MAVQININQAAKPPGVAGQAREDLNVAVAVTLTAVGGPFSQYQWTLIDAPPNATLTASSVSTLSAPTSSTTLITPDYDGTYLLELAVDAGFGLGARPEDVTRKTFYAGATLNPIIDQLPRRVPSFFEQLEHNVPDALNAGGNIIGWAREWQRWFKVIALAMTSGLTPPVNPGENAEVAFGWMGNLRYATGVKVLNPTAAEDGISLTRVQAATANLTIAAGGAAPDKIVFEAVGATVAEFDKAGPGATPRLAFGATNAVVRVPGTGILWFDLAGAIPRVSFDQAVGQAVRVFHQTNVAEFSRWDTDRIRFRTDDGLDIGYDSITNQTAGGQDLVIWGQSSKVGSGTAGGKIQMKTGAEDGVGFAPGAFEVAVGGSAPAFFVGRDGVTAGSQWWTAFGVGTKPPKGDIRTQELFQIYSYGGFPGTGRRVLETTSTDVHLGYNSTDTWPVNAYVWVHGTLGLKVDQGTASVFATLHGQQLQFVADAAVNISRTVHSSGAGASTKLSGQSAFPTSGALGGALELESGAGDAGAASHGPINLLAGGILVAQVYYDSVRIKTAMELRFYDGATNYVAFKSPTLAGITTYVLPAADGSSGEQLTTDGAGNLSWQAGTVPLVTSVFGRAGAVVAASGDYTSNLVTNSSGTVPGATVTAAMENAYHVGVASEIQGTTLKGTPVAADVLLIEDSAASWVKKRIAISSMPTSAPVTSVFGRVGVVAAAAGDYAASQVTNDSGISGTNVDDALNTLGGAISTHISDSANPHSTSIANIGGGTLAQLNAAVSGGSLDFDTASRPPSGAASGGLGGTYPSPTVDGMTSGVLTNDTAHGVRGGGTLHASVTNSLSGFVPAVGAANTILQSTGSAAAWNTNLNMGGNIDLNNNPVFAVRDLTFQEEYSESGSAIPFDVEQFVVKTLTSNATLTLDSPTGPCHRQLRVVQGGSGSYTITWTTTVEWVGGGSAPTLSTGVGDVDIINFFWNGTTWYGQAGLDFA